MPAPVLVDTSAWIEALRPEGSEEVRREVQLAVEEGVAVPATDLLIAACAAHHGATLLHQDSHFDQISEIKKKT